MTYALDTASMTKKQEELHLEEAEILMLRFSLRVTRKDKIMNERTRGTLQMNRFGQKIRQPRLRLFGHVKRGNDDYAGRKMLQMQFPEQKDDRSFDCDPCSD